jgi:prepilin-type N-terminal cleavage/methylation domain-containing protein
MTISRRAFTLIELLVVIAIVGLLSTIAIINLSSTRGKARDLKRIADIKQISTALELYRDTNGVFPNPGTLGCAGGSQQYYCLGHGNAGTCWIGGYLNGCTALDNALAPYMAKIPDDPGQNTGFNGDAYLYNFNQGGINPPILHWGMEGAVNTSTCLGGTFGTWGTNFKFSPNYCNLFFQ